jgi:DNA polymerase III subunit gamma/tau
VLSELKTSGRMALFTYLIGTKATVLDSKFIGIVFEPGRSLNKMVVSKAENLEVIETVLNQKLSAEYKIKCINADELQSASKENAKEQPDELLDKAKNLADRLNVPLNIIDE